MTPRRFPPPWSIEELNACFIVRDHNGQKLAYLKARIAPESQGCAAKKGPTDRYASGPSLPMDGSNYFCFVASLAFM